MREADWEKLGSLAEEVERLKSEGKWTTDAFERILNEAEAACHDELVDLEFLYIQRPGNLLAHM